MKLTYLSLLALSSYVAGEAVLHPNKSAKKCLEVRGNVRKNGTPVQIFDCNGTQAQQWVLNTGHTALRLAGSTFCLDAGKAPANGTPMKIWKCEDGNAAQQWVYNTNGRIMLNSGGLCLDLTNGSLNNGNVVQVWKCSSGTNQIWRKA